MNNEIGISLNAEQKRLIKEFYTSECFKYNIPRFIEKLENLVEKCIYAENNLEYGANV